MGAGRVQQKIVITPSVDNTMNIFNYAVRYLWILTCTNYQENYWDQVKENEKWFKMVERILMKGKRSKG